VSAIGKSAVAVSKLASMLDYSQGRPGRVPKVAVARTGLVGC
jgi:hypothetical protein